MPNFELLEQIQKLRSENKTLSLSTSNRKINEELLLEIHDLYVNGYLHLPEFHETFGYPRHKSIVRLFRNRRLKVLDRAKVEELYSKEIHNKIKKTSLERYGVENAMQSPEIQERLKRSNLERYGVENPSQYPEIRKKIEANNLKKFGSISPAGSPEIRKKIEQTNTERYGHEYPVGSPEIRKKIEQTNLEKYGSVSPFGSKEIWNKVIQTNLERYGSVSAFGCPEIQEKIKQTNLKRYNHVNPFGSKEIQEKIKSSNLQRYGFEYATQSPEIRQKLSQRLNSEEVRDKYKRTRKSNDSRYAKLLDLVENEPDKASQFVLGNYPHNHAAILRRYGLYQENLSTPEAAIREILEKHKIEYQFKYRPKFMRGKELDFFIPASNNPDTGKPVAIEVNGLYWHSYPKKDKFYHQDKHLRCRSEGIQLLSFTEDQILEKSEIIESMILHKLGKTPYRVYAKNCDIRELSTKEAKDFLEKNHLHGFSNASAYLGLEYEGKLVHVMSFGNNRFKKSNHPELIRSASLRFHSVAGGFQRLLKYYKRSHGVDLIESYVDFNISNGQSYELASKDLGDLGVGPVRETVRETKRDNLTEPDLWFVFRGKRYHRQKFMKHNLHKIFSDFPKRSEDGYKDITVREFLRERGVLEYYGAGNLKYLI